MSRNQNKKQQSVLQKNKKKKAPMGPKSSRASSSNLQQRGAILPISAISRMLRDPCTAPLRAGSYGSAKGDVIQVKIRWTPPPLSDGFPHLAVVWFPDYNDASGADNTAVNANLFYWPAIITSDPTYPTRPGFGTAPYNSTSSQWTSYGSMKDPGADIINTGLYASCRTVGACMRVTYTGKTSEEAGEIYAVPNITPFQTVKGGPTDNPPGISQLITMTPIRGERASQCEVRFRPVNESMEFGSKDTHFMTCNPTTAPSHPGQSQDATGIGLVLYRVNNITDYAFEFIKDLEIIPEPGAGLSCPAPRGVDDMRDMNRAILALESSNPSWQVSYGKSHRDSLESSLRAIVLGGRG